MSEKKLFDIFLKVMGQVAAVDFRAVMAELERDGDVYGPEQAEALRQEVERMETAVTRFTGYACGILHAAVERADRMQASADEIITRSGMPNALKDRSINLLIK